MKRRQVIRVYLMKSLIKRLWMVILPAVALGIAVFIMTSSLRISLLVTLLVALCVKAGILWSSYHRHLDEFPDDDRVDIADALIVDD
jgi:hypothetical protein